MTITTADVRNIFTTAKLDSDIQPFVDYAALVVGEDLGSSGMSTARLDMITTYLAAHFLAFSVDGENNGLLKSMKMGDASETYDVPSGEFGYLSSRYGQMALALDSSGKLAASQSNKSVKATFEVVGNVPSLTYYIRGYYSPGF